MTAAKKESKEVTPFQQVGSMLKRMEKEFKTALPTTVKADKFVRCILTELQANPELLVADRNSLYGACMRAAQDGLLPDRREGALVIFGKNVQWMPMVFGLCKRARNSGEIEDMDAVVVKENDQFDYWYDEKGVHFMHKPAKLNRGNDVLTYAFARTKTGGSFFEPIDEQQMAEIEKVSRAKNGPWKGPFRGEMKRKSAIRRMCKYRLPSSTDIDDVFKREDEQYDVTPENMAEPTETATKPSRLSGLLGKEDAAELANQDWDVNRDGPKPEQAP